MDVAPGINSLGNRHGGHVHAYLLDDGRLILAELARIGRAPHQHQVPLTP